jgi:hypothetical protein
MPKSRPRPSAISQVEQGASPSGWPAKTFFFAFLSVLSASALIWGALCAFCAFSRPVHGGLLKTPFA